MSAPQQVLLAYKGAVSNTYATWNPSDKNAGVTLSNGNLTMTTVTTNYVQARSTVGVTSGKWYWEVVYTSIVLSDAMTGIANGSMSLATGNYVGLDANGWGVYTPTGNKLHNGANTAYGSACGANTIMCALDMDNGKVWWGLNGTWFNSGNPASGTNAAYTTGITGTIYACSTVLSTNEPTLTANFGATAQSYSAPSGFNAGLYA